MSYITPDLEYISKNLEKQANVRAIPVEELRKIISIDPENIQPCITLGDIYYEGRRYPEAEGMYEKAVNMNPFYGMS
jgi:tetratricopeptide (TPR) repeat protein